MKVTQTDSGKAWEYGLACQCAKMFNRHANLAVNNPSTKSKKSYGMLDNQEQGRIDRAANEAALFLRTHDSRLLKTKSVVMQSDMKGASGDVRDILVKLPSGEIGISAKHRHDALKHSRLSKIIDFGLKWYGVTCSECYREAVAPVFSRLQDERRKGKMWRDFPDKEECFYTPVLHAFIQEISCNAKPDKMVRYLLGRHDFYKVIKDNGNVVLQSFNMGGGLQWGKQIPLPDQIIRFTMKPNSSTTAIIFLNNGWQISFRIHNASALVEPSLKLDVRLEGCPSTLSRHEIPFG